MFNIISRKTILEYCQKHRDASAALKVWYHTMQKSGVTNFNELKVVQIKWFGKHRAYDKIKAGKINFN